jgi:hypothetical protein
VGGNEQSHIVEWPYTQGQNEGTERAVLPVGQFSYLQNARYRKQQRLGKRRGYTSVSSLDSQGDALGSGNGRLNCLGPYFCAVDDTFYRRNEVDGTWQAKPSIGVLGGGRSLWNQFPQFTPGPIIDPPTQESLEINGAPASFSGMTTGLGFIWTAEGRIYNGAWYICTTAIDPATGLSVFKQDVLLAGVATTDTPSVQLLSMPTPATIVLLTDGFTAGVKTSVQVSTLIDLDNGFSSPTGFTCIESAANYYPTSTNRLLFCYVLTGTPTTLRIGTLDPDTVTVASLVTVGAAGNKTLLSIFGQAAGDVCVGYFDAAAVRLATFDAAFVANGAASITASIPTAAAPVMFAERSGVSIFKLAAVVRGTGHDTFVLCFSAVGAVTTVVMRQRNCLPMSQPFSIGTTQLFMWLRYRSGEGLGVASLVRVPHEGEWAGGAASLPGVFPVQATVDDRDVAPPLTELPPGFTLHSGPPFPTPLPTSLGYVALINYTRSSFVSGSTVRYMRSVALVPVRHLSEGPRYAMSSVTPCIDRQFVAGAQPQWVDSISAYEAGFIQAPVSIAAPIQAGGGALTAVATYSYTVVFESEVGTVVERSAPAVPVTVTLTGVNNAITTRWTTLELGARRQVTAKVYRTAANGSVFYFLNKFDASPGSSALGYFDFVDGYADSDIIQNEALYINIGQELAASNFPACTFANVGGNRLWCGGGFAGNRPQASKLFAPHLAPEFADDDAFRVTLPANCTGGAWCDSQVFFTQEGIYQVSGDGPDGSGSGFFTTTRLPFNIGCIDWRSVVVCDLGVMFQSARGLYLLPRGFGTPVPMDQVIDTLTTYPIITSARSDYNSTGGADNSEQIVQWTAVADEAATSGVIITFDSAYKAFSVDTFGADYPAVFQTGWGGDAVHSPALMTIGGGGASAWHPFRVYDSTDYDDEGLPIAFTAITGDVRPWGTFGHGVIERLGFLGEMRSACTVNVTKTTDKGTRVADPRVYTAVAPDPLVGASFYLAVDLGSEEQKDVTTLRTQISESSTLEGVTLSAMVFELQDGKQNYKLLRIADRIG